MRFFLLCLTIFAFTNGSFADHHFSFEGLINNGSGSAVTEDLSIPVREDNALETSLRRHSEQVTQGSFVDRDREMIFLKLTQEAVVGYLEREKQKTGTTEYGAWLEQHAGDREGVMGYAEDENQRFRIFYDEEQIKDPKRDLAFLKLAISGFVFDKKDFPFLSSKIAEKIEQNRLATLLRKEDGTWKVQLDKPKVKAYLMYYEGDRGMRPIVVSGKTVELVLDAWVQQSLETAFIQYLGFDQSYELLTTNDRWDELKKKLQQIITELKAIQVGIERALNRYSLDMTESDGQFFQIDRPWIGSDRYRFTKAMAEKLESYSNYFKEKSSEILVGTLFGEEEFRNALGRIIESLDKSKNWVKSNQWVDTKPTRSVLSSLKVLISSIEVLQTISTSKAGSHARIYRDHVGKYKSVLLE